ncbi:MAG: membrane dipeptidase [Phycisphaeraceae bacterium]|nr:membrane dipeptidase [Phycisphaeraceae bacterium]
MLPLFDAHLDLACLAVNGRDMHAEPDRAGGPWLPAAVTLPSLREGNIACALATVFTEAVPHGETSADAVAYPMGDADAAHRKGRAQLEVYMTWADNGHARLDLRRALRVDPHLGTVRAGMGVAESLPDDPVARLARAYQRPKNPSPITLGVLVENADPVRSPDELAWWVERGVVAVGLTWARPSRYSGGNLTPELGLTDLGREMIRAMDAQGVTHDLSHLSQRATRELLEATDAPVVASHSNCRAIVDPGGTNERHLADDTIVEIGRRGGVIGINLFGVFLRPKQDGRARIEDVVAHIERICELTGRRDGVGLGSDMDGGLSANDLPEGIARPRDIHRVLDALRDRGWSQRELEGFAYRNWAAFFGKKATPPRTPITASPPSPGAQR